MPLFTHPKGLDCLLPGEAPEVQKHGGEFLKRALLGCSKWSEWL